MKRHTKTATRLARKYHCDPRTIRNWRRQKAPLHDPKAMRDWLANRKNLPPNLPLGVEPGTTAPALELMPAAEQTGAPAALDRLQRAEVSAFNRLQKAQAGADPVLIRNCRSDWLRMLEALRHYERCVTADRRALGQLVERGEVESALALFGQALRVTFEGALPTLANEILSAGNDRIRVRQLLRRTNWYAFHSSLAVGYAARIPKWVIQAYGTDIQNALTAAATLHGDLERWGEALRQAGRACAEAALRDTDPAPVDIDKADGKATKPVPPQTAP